MTPDSGDPQPTATATQAAPPASAPAAPSAKEESVAAIVAATAFFSLLLVLPLLMWISGSAEGVGPWIGKLVIATAIGWAGLIGCVITLLLHLKPAGAAIRWEARWTPLFWAAFLPPFTFAFLILFATHGLMPLAGVWVLTLAPSAFLVWRARRAGPAAVDAPGLGMAVWAWLGLVPVTSILFVLIVLGLDAESKRDVGTPSFGPWLGRYHSVMRYADLRTPVDPSVDPQTAGDALHSIARMGTAQPVLPEKQPVRKYTNVWVTDDGSAVGHIPREWAKKLIPMAAQGFTPQQAAYLRTVASHPAHAEFRTLARAGTVDFVSAEFVTPIGKQFQLGSLPIIPRKTLLDGGHAHVAAAALDLAEGRPADAEAKLKEVYTTGIILIEQSPMLIDGGLGLLVAEEGRDGLREFYRVTGRADELARLEQPDIPASRYASVHDFPTPADSAAPRAMRWQSVTYTSMKECFGLRGIVFGPGAERAEAIEQAHKSLARTPGEHAWVDLVDDTPRRIARAQSSQLGPLQRMTRRIFGNGAASVCPRALKLDAVPAA